MATPLEAEEIRSRLTQLGQGWALEEVDGTQRLWRQFRTPDFVSAVELLDAITPEAEAENHHPDIELGWGRVRVMLTTHSAGGLTENDFLVAARVSKVARERGLE